MDPFYLDESERLGRLLAESGWEIIYGGGRVGLMGRLAEGVIKAGGSIKGVIPRFMMTIELGHNGITELQVVNDMHERQAIMQKEADVIITLPGGSGSFCEFFESISWRRLGLITAPIVLLNLKNYYAPMIEMLDKSIGENFMHKEYHRIWKTTNTLEETMDYVNGLEVFKGRKIEIGRYI